MKNLLFAFGIMTASALSALEIIEPAAKDGSLRLAVQELRHHLALVADDVPYRFVFAKPDDVKEVAPFESRYRVRDCTVWFWGDDRGRETQRRNGTLFAVELFGERELGLRYLWPGADGVAVTKPKTPILSLPRHAEGRHVSTLVKARIRSYAQYHPFPWEQVKAYMPRELYDAPRPTTHEERILWQRRNRLQDREYFTYGHAFTHWKDRFEKSHPEYLNLHIDAKTGEATRGWTATQGRDRTKHCVSNEAVVDQILADWCANGTNRFLNVCENDSGFWCECPACRTLDVPKEGEKPLTHVSDRYVNFWNRIAKKARAIRPDVQLVTYIYSDYRLPPRREKIAYGENMLCGFVFAEAEDAMALINDWRKAGMRHFFFRPNYLHSIVTIHRGYERFFYNQFHELLAAGMIGVDYDANDNRPMTTLEFYVLARAFADPKASFESIVADYYAGYGAAAADVKAYFEAVRQTGEAALEECRRLARNPNSDFGGGGTLPRTEETGRNEAELQAKHDMLAASVARHTQAADLSAVEMARLKSLLLQAEHGILTYRFLTAVAARPVPEMKRAAEALNAFRIAHKDDLPDIYVQIYRLWWAEVRYWKLYRKRLQEPRGADDVARLEAMTDGRKVLHAANEQTKSPDVLISAHPRLFTDDAGFAAMKARLGTDAAFDASDKILLRLAERYLKTQPVERKLIGFRLLDKAREALGRISSLSMAYRLHGDRRFLARAVEEMKAVCAFSDWNPRHYLDVAEFSLGVSIGYDWLYNDMSPEDRETIGAGLERLGWAEYNRVHNWDKVTMKPGRPKVMQVKSNWGQVCNGGAIAVALALRERVGAAAADRLVKDAVDGLKIPMSVYAPKGCYPEGPGYWSYGTDFSVLSIAMLDFAYGTNYGLADLPGFRETGAFTTYMCGPSGIYFNYSDSGSARMLDMSIWWFAHKYQDAELVADWEFPHLLAEANAGRARVDRVHALQMLWAKAPPADLKPKRPLVWSSECIQQVVVQRSGWGKDDFFFAIKGGTPRVNHGHMDVGSFVLDVLGERWAWDLGAESYNKIESLGLSLWNSAQKSDRWRIFRLNNMSHNVVSVDDEPQLVKGEGKLLSLTTEGVASTSRYDLTGVAKNVCRSWTRQGALAADGRSFTLTDELTGLKPGAVVRWAMTTKAAASATDSGVTLRRNGKTVKLASVGATPGSWQVVEAKGKESFDAANLGTQQVLLSCPAPASGSVQFAVRFCW